MRVVLGVFAVFVVLVLAFLLPTRQTAPPRLIAFVSDRDGIPAIYRMAADGRFIQPHFAAINPICTLTGGPDQFVVITVPPHQNLYPFCSPLFFETNLLTATQFYPMRHISLSEFGSLDPKGVAYIQDTWLNEALSDQLLFRTSNLRVQMHCPAPTDDRIAFVGQRAGRYDLYVYDDGAVVQLSSFRGAALRLVCPAWSEDGRWVALLVGTELWVIDTHTHAQRLLRDDVRDVRANMAWSEDGQWVAFVGRIIRTALYVVRVSDGGAWEAEFRVPNLAALMWADGWLVYDGPDRQLHAFYPPSGPIRTLTSSASNTAPTPLNMHTRPLRTSRLLLLAAAAVGLGLLRVAYMT